MRSRAFVRSLPPGFGLGRWALLLLLVASVAPGRAQAQQLSLQLDSDEVYAGLPFVLTVAARGFDESPQPTLSKLAIPGCKVTSLGVSPNVSSMVQIVNGQRSEFRNVTFAYRFRVEATQSGQYTVPPLTAEQGGKKATSPPARFSVKSVDDTKDMQLRLILPERPLWVGETVDATLEWYLRRDVGQRTFSVPLFDQDEWVEIEAPPGQPRLGGFQAGSRQLELPYSQDKANLDGSEFARFRFQFRLTPSKVGTLSLPPARIVAALNVGFGRDVFGFQVPESRLFAAATKPLKLEIRPLPQAGRPASFKNAVGSAFNIEVSAGRTVVRVGDPIELRILLRGKGRLAGLILPELPSMGLSEQQFAAPEEPPAGEVLEDGKGKLFRVSVRLRSTDAKEIPALSFGYFDPSQGSYQTVHSQPIALSVKGSAVVGAGDVVGSGPAASAAGATATGTGTGAGVSPGAGKPQAASEASLPLVGADLALSDDRQTWRRATSLHAVMPLLLAMYGAAAALVVIFVLRRRGQAGRQRDAEARRLLRAVQDELARATQEAARDAAPRLCTALRNLRRELALPSDEGSRLLERLETETYSADAASRPLAAGLRSEVDELARSWMKRGRTQPAAQGGPGAAAGLGVVAFFIGLYPIISVAQDSAAEAKLKQARSSYQAALGQTDRDRRRSGFAEAEGMLRELCQTYPDRPELLADWGNAALLSQEPGRALLASRRALRLDPSLERARRNLSFLREHQPDWLPRPRAGGAADSLLSWAQLWPVPRRHVLLAAALLLVTALLLPWSESPQRRRRLRLLAIAPALGGLAMGLPLALERDQGRDAVLVVSGATLRSADSLGAPPAVGHALPAGTEVTVDEVRGDWTRVALADGQNGWLASSIIESL